MTALRFSTLRAVVLAAFAVLALPVAGDGPPDAAALFAERCQACHDLGVLAPTRAQLERLTVEEIEAALWHGTMQEHANGLTRPERLAIARLLGRPDSPPPARSPGVTLCNTDVPLPRTGGPAWRGWSHDNRFDRHLADRT